jgi:hypothetical protein
LRADADGDPGDERPATMRRPDAAMATDCVGFSRRSTMRQSDTPATRARTHVLWHR